MIKQILYIITFLFALILLRLFVFEIYTINQNSMNNTYQTSDRVLILKNFYSIKHNDVLVFKRKNENMIKRCIGLPGESIKIINGKTYSNNKLISLPPKAILGSISTIDIYSKTEISYTYNASWNLNNFGCYTIPAKGMKILLTPKNLSLYKKLIEDDNNNSKKMHNPKNNYYVFQNNYVFLIGDNRVQSVDSRFFGPIKESEVKGKVILDIF